MQEPVFVGRERELDELEQHLDHALAGHGQVCFIAGEAGSGKTALVHQFVQQALVANPDLIVAFGSCNAQTGIGDPYLPFREALTMLTDDTARQPEGMVSAQNANRLQAIAVRSVQVLVETAPELIGVFVPGAALLGALGRAVVKKVGWMDQLDELAKRKTGLGAPVPEQSRIFEQYTAFLQRLSTKTPLILFLDDLQWADTASLGLLFYLGRNVNAGHILILGAYRPNDVALGRGGERHPLEPVVHELTRYHGDVTVDLNAIPETVNQAFVDALLDAEPNALGDAFREALFHQTGGHALFTVEMIRTLQERGDLVRNGDGRWVEGPSLDWEALPARVEGVIAERIDRLSDELRELLTVGSVEGEQFSAEVAARVQDISARQAVHELSDALQRRHRLVSAQGLVQIGQLRLSLYHFLHNLFQQYLYGNLDAAERAYLHRDVGEVIETLFAGQTEDVAGQLARHFEEGGIPAKAAAYRLQAGMQAQRMSAYQEAVTHLTRGLELLRSVLPGAEQMQLELGLQTSLGTALIATHGYASPDVEKTFVRARELCRALGDPPQVVPVICGLALFRLVRGELTSAFEEGEKLLRIAEREGEAGSILAARALLGATALYLGHLDDARAHFEETVALYDRPKHCELAHQFGQDPCVTALSYLSWLLWLQGYPDQAQRRARSSVELATELGHPYSLGQATSWSAILHQMMRQWPESKAQAEAAFQLACQGHFPLWQATGAMVHGTAIAYEGHVEEGLAELSQGLDAFEATGAQLSLPYFRARLADLYLVAGRQLDGLKALEEAQRHTEQVWWLPEHHRLHADLLLLVPGSETEAEAHLRKALEMTGRQKLKSLELRTALDLARLLRQQGRAAEGQDLLAECYGWFTEGFETPDLRETREVLERWAQQ